MNRRSSTAIAFMALLAPLHASAQEGWRDVYVCGASKGHSYLMSGEGWQEDGISQGVIVLKQRGREFDVQIADAVSSFSALEDGATVTGRESGEGVIQIVAIYPEMTVETYLFSKAIAGRSTLAWTASKNRPFSNARTSVFVSSCIAR